MERNLKPETGKFEIKRRKHRAVVKEESWLAYDPDSYGKHSKLIWDFFFFLKYSSPKITLLHSTERK